MRIPNIFFHVTNILLHMNFLEGWNLDPCEM